MCRIGVIVLFLFSRRNGRGYVTVEEEDLERYEDLHAASEACVNSFTCHFYVPNEKFRNLNHTTN